MNAAGDTRQGPKRSTRSRAVRCPSCGKPTVWAGNPTRPFCSERCRTTDLSAWASGEYTLPSEESASEDSPGSDGGDGI